MKSMKTIEFVAITVAATVTVAVVVKIGVNENANAYVQLYIQHIQLAVLSRSLVSSGLCLYVCCVAHGKFKCKNPTKK